MIHPRLLNQVFENKNFSISRFFLDYLVRDIINMNWWNTSGVLLGYDASGRVTGPFSETQKRIAVQLKEFCRYRRILLCDSESLNKELREYITKKRTTLLLLGTTSMRARANPSQYFERADGTMTWVDCTSRATYAAKYVFQNGYIDFDGKCRVIDGTSVAKAVASGGCFDLGISEHFVDGENTVKAEIFSQKTSQRTVADWVSELGIQVLPERLWLINLIGHIRTDPYKNFEASMVTSGRAAGVNECLYGYKTSASVGGAASHASSASGASNASRASRASDASNASRASNASSASDASRARDAGTTGTTLTSWADCSLAIKKPDGLNYPKEFRSNIFAIAGNWKIDKNVVACAKLGWFDPFSGHGTSPLFAKRHGIRYLGFDTNKLAFETHLNAVNLACAGPGADVSIRLHDSTIFMPELEQQFDLCYTSPPYFNFEEYGGNRSHYAGCNTYGDFHRKISIPVLQNVYQYLIADGILALQVEKNTSNAKLWREVCLRCGFFPTEQRLTGGEQNKYSTMSKRDQSLLVFRRP